MLDSKFVRENPELVQQKSSEKGYDVDVAATLALDAEYRGLLIQVEDIRRGRNELAASMKSAKPTEEQITRGRELKDTLAGLEDTLKDAEAAFLADFKKIPNMPTEDVPVGASEDENVIAKEMGEKPQFAFAPKNHWQIGEARGWIDKERATKVAGARFAYLKGDLVKLEWALMQYALNILTDEALLAEIAVRAGLSVSPKAFTPVLPPLMIRTEPYDAMDRLEPRVERYKIEGEELWLQGSAEHVLGSMHAGEIFDEADMPVRYVGFATSFRREAGSYGKDMEGIIRLHQFNKLEMETFSTKETSLEEHLFLIAIQEYFVQSLGLPYQLVMKCTADIGKPNARGVDIDTWLPGQGKYRETHTADYMTDYQARRLNTRVRRKDGSVELIHTNDATMSSERPLIAIIENYQQENDTVVVPEVLRPYMQGREVI